MQVLLSSQQLNNTIAELAMRLNKSHPDLNDVVFVGIQQGGAVLGANIIAALQKLAPSKKIQYGQLDITFYRDDIRKELHMPNQTDISFSIEGKKVVLIDDVLYTGRTIRAALDALMDFGRPEKVELLALIDRRYSRQLPIQPDYTGRVIDSIVSQKVKVLWNEKDKKDEVILVD